jgi:hydrogenase nickel incorporation protein HypB
VPRAIDLREGVLSKNDELAAALRARFEAAGILAVNVVSSPGSGKTALLEVLLTRLRERRLRTAALVGDCATENDAARLARSGVPVRQIVTAGLCHLEADLVARHLAGIDLDDLDVLIVENVGNLVCPTGFDLGEEVRVVGLSVTEGEDKPLKYPHIFASADLAVITKIDLAAATEFDRAAAYAAIAAVAPTITVLETSARTGAGVDDLVTELLRRRERLVPPAPTLAPTTS